MYEEINMTTEKMKQLFSIEENYFNDFKAKEINPAKLSKTVSAYANASGGDIYLGVREDRNLIEMIPGRVLSKSAWKKKSQL